MEGKIYFINAFMEVDETENEETQRLLLRAGNYFKTRAAAIRCLKLVSTIIYNESNASDRL
jgi:hypothetical protein